MFMSIVIQQMTPQWPPHQKSCLSLSRYHPVAIPHGCCSRDYYGDNPEVKGSVPGVGPPTLQAGSPGAPLLPLRRLLFTSCHFEVSKWIQMDGEHKLKQVWEVCNNFSCHKLYGEEIIGTHLAKGSCLQCSYYWLNTDEKTFKILSDCSNSVFNNVGGFIVIIF